MTLSKESWDRDFGGTWLLECDVCGKDEEIEGDFDDCIEFINDSGWKSRKEKYGWEHSCPKCKLQKCPKCKNNILPISTRTSMVGIMSLICPECKYEIRKFMLSANEIADMLNIKVTSS